jgi:hypothetical protein
MSGRPHRLAWAPPFLVGASAAIAAEVAVALLLYSGPGFVRSLTAVLAVAAAAFAGGLWTAPARGSGATEALRRRWLLSLFAFFAAALFGGAWSVMSVLGMSRWGQALGLTLLAGLPLFASGGVIGGLAAVAPSVLGPTRVGATAAFGAATGAVVTGLLLPRTPLPASVLLSCLVMLSLGGMVFGVIAGTAVEVDVLAERRSRAGSVRVEDRRLATAGVAERVLLEGLHVRRRVPLDGNGPAPWDVAVARALMPDPDRPWRVLAVGSGASTLARTVVREHPSGTIDILERSPEIVDLAREHLDTGLFSGVSERVSVGVGNLEDLLKGIRDRYDLVVVDSGGLAPLGGAPGLSREARGRLVQAVATSGALAWGPAGPDDGMPELAAAWPRFAFGRVGGRAHGASGSGSRHASSSGGTPDEADIPDERSEQIVLLTRNDRTSGEALAIEGFVARNGDAPAHDTDPRSGFQRGDSVRRGNGDERPT